jgi:hypothetical protein
MTASVAALFVQRDGIYWNRPDLDAWDEERDARLYAGSLPVVAHPPCSRWCQLAPVNQARYGQKIGDDGGCFAFALETVRRCGGVLEHPASTLAWPRFGLIEPVRGAWSRCIDGGWTTEVSQGVYGHPARKLTWLYYVGEAPPPLLDWGLIEPTAQCGHKAGHNNRRVLGKREASATPPAFAELLLNLARSARAQTGPPSSHSSAR